MRVLVTGGAGFVGSHLCERLIKDGHEVIALDSLVTGKLSNLDHLIDHPRMSFVQANASEELPVDGKLDRIFHLASPASPIDYVEIPFVTLYAGSAQLPSLSPDALLRRFGTEELVGGPTGMGPGGGGAAERCLLSFFPRAKFLSRFLLFLRAACRRSNSCRVSSM